LEKGFEFKNIRSLGTGRVNRWAEVFETYSTELSTLEQLFGTSNAYNAHNQYLAFLMQVGLIGFFLFLLIVFRFILLLWKIYVRYRDSEIFVGLTILVMFLVYGTTGHPFFYTTLLWYLMIPLGMINVYRYNSFINKYRITNNFNNQIVDKIN
jgi:O-antigen ligase